MSRADSALRHAVDLQGRLKAEGNHRDAEIVRAICHSYRGLRETTSRLHADNLALRKGGAACNLIEAAHRVRQSMESDHCPSIISISSLDPRHYALVEQLVSSVERLTAGSASSGEGEP